MPALAYLSLEYSRIDLQCELEFRVSIVTVPGILQVWLVSRGQDQKKCKPYLVIGSFSLSLVDPCTK